MTQAPTPRSPRSRGYAILLATMGLLLVAWPALKRAGLPPYVLPWIHGALFTLMLAAILNAIRPGRERRAFLILLVVALIASWAADLIAEDAATIVGSAGGTLFLVLVTTMVLRRVFAPGRVTVDRILAALCAYFFIGMLWANLYRIVHASATLLGDPAFRFPSGEIVSQTDFTYYSFVTLTTLGYGDVTPLHPLARSLSYMEAIVGQLYIAVIVARLVALQIVHASVADAQEEDPID